MMASHTWGLEQKSLSKMSASVGKKHLIYIKKSKGKIFFFTFLIEFVHDLTLQFGLIASFISLTPSSVINPEDFWSNKS